MSYYSIVKHKYYVTDKAQSLGDGWLYSSYSVKDEKNNFLISFTI